MRILETAIPDVHEGNLDQSKIVLANKIIDNVYPLFDDVYSEKLSSIAYSKKELQTKKQNVLNAKNELEHFVVEFNRRKKVKKLLEKISKVVPFATADGTLRNEVVVLLKIVDKLPGEKLDEHLLKITKTITKRFGS